MLSICVTVRVSRCSYELADHEILEIEPAALVPVHRALRHAETLLIASALPATDFA